MLIMEIGTLNRLAAIAGLVQADDQAVADERHRRRPLQGGDVAQADGGVGGSRGRGEAEAERGDEGDTDGRGQGRHDQKTLLSTRMSQPGLRLSFIRPRPK